MKSTSGKILLSLWFLILAFSCAEAAAPTRRQRPRDARSDYDYLYEDRAYDRRYDERAYPYDYGDRVYDDRPYYDDRRYYDDRGYVEDPYRGQVRETRRPAPAPRAVPHPAPVYGVRRDARNGLDEYLPRVSSFEFRQMGGTDLMVDIWGNDMPLPQISNYDNRTLIVLRGVYGENARRYENLGLNPLVTSVRSEQVGQDFIITVTTEKPLQAKAVRGVPPCDSYTLHLTTGETFKKMTEERTATDQPQTLRVPTGPFASNTPITLDLRDAELRDVFRMLGEQLKKNIIIHDSLPPVLVTMTFKKSPLSNVFGYLMKNYDLGYEFVDNDTIIVGTAAGLSRISGKEETRSYRVAYAEADSIAKLLPNLTKISGAGLVVDPRLRTIYATAAPDVLEEVAIVIQKLDHPGKQVMLQARILQFSKGDSLQVEKALNAIYDHWAFTYSNGMLSGIYADDNRRGRPTTIPVGIDSGRLLPPGLGNVRTPIQGIWREFDVSFQALEEKTNVKTLANPSVITIDGVEANISLTEEYPYISGRDDGGNATWSNITVGPILKMTPTVGRDDTVTLTLDLQTSDRIGTAVGSTGEQVPQVSKRQVITNVRVRNGEPFVVGGLFREDKTDNKLRIPVLGNLPLLGEIFTYRVKNARTTQVVMVVIPYILHTPDVGVEQERVMMKQ